MTPVNPADLVDQVVDRLVTRYKPLRIIVFGSVARGESKPGSDLDLLVLMPGIGRDESRLEREAEAALADLPIEKDLHFCTPEAFEKERYLLHSFLRPAFTEGKTVYDSGYNEYVNDKNVDTSNPDPDDEVRWWLDQALWDLKHMHILARDPGSAGHGICFFAQQATEKALKAFLISVGKEPRHTHELGTLIAMIPLGDWSVKDIDFTPFIPLTRFSDFARHLRYPPTKASEFVDAVDGDAEDCLEIALLVWDRITSDLARRGIFPPDEPTRRH
jgi:HEPN domain-containing protein/predicted nucleotidyltransferase